MSADAATSTTCPSEDDLKLSIQDEAIDLDAERIDLDDPEAGDIALRVSLAIEHLPMCRACRRHVEELKAKAFTQSRPELFAVDGPDPESSYPEVLMPPGQIAALVDGTWHGQ